MAIVFRNGRLLLEDIIVENGHVGTRIRGIQNLPFELGIPQVLQKVPIPIWTLFFIGIFAYLGYRIIKDK